MSDFPALASSTPSYLGNCSEKSEKVFWLQWQQYRDHLQLCCIKWMGGNSTDAEDALSRAMLKAWEKVQQYAGKITNFKAWLTRLKGLCDLWGFLQSVGKLELSLVYTIVSV